MKAEEYEYRRTSTSKFIGLYKNPYNWSDTKVHVVLMEPYTIVTCDDDDIIGILIPRCGLSRGLVEALPAVYLAYRVEGRDTELHVSSDPDHNFATHQSSALSNLVHPVVALRRTREPYTLGSGDTCNIILPFADNINPEALRITLSANEPNITIQSLAGGQDNIFINHSMIGSRVIETSSITNLQIDNLVFSLVPVKLLIASLRTRISAPAALASINLLDNLITAPVPDLSSIEAAVYNLRQTKPHELVAFKQGKALGIGGQGEVYPYICPKSSVRLAIKTLTYHDDDHQDYAKKKRSIKREVTITLKIPENEHLVRVLEIFEFPTGFALVMPLLQHGSLRNFMKNKGSINEYTAKEISIQVLKALKSLHDQSIIHRDVKADNVLVQAENPIFVKLTDFGWSKMAQSTATPGGSPYYVPPEVHHYQPGRRYTNKVDIYCTGILVLVLLGLAKQLPRYPPMTQQDWNKGTRAMIRREIAYNSGLDRATALTTAGLMAAFTAEDRPSVLECFHLPWLNSDTSNTKRLPQAPNVPSTSAQAVAAPDHDEEDDSQRETIVLPGAMELLKRRGEQAAVKTQAPLQEPEVEEPLDTDQEDAQVGIATPQTLKAVRTGRIEKCQQKKAQPKLRQEVVKALEKHISNR